MAKSRSSAKKKLSKSQLEIFHRLDPEGQIKLLVRSWHAYQQLNAMLLQSPKSDDYGDSITSALQAYIVDPFPAVADLLDIKKIGEQIAVTLGTEKKSERRKEITLRDDFDPLFDVIDAAVDTIDLNWKTRARSFLANFPLVFPLVDEHCPLHYEATVYRLCQGTTDCSGEIERIVHSWAEIAKRECNPIHYTGPSKATNSSFSGNMYRRRNGSSVLRLADFGKIGGFSHIWQEELEDWVSCLAMRANRASHRPFSWDSILPLGIYRSSIAREFFAILGSYYIRIILRHSPEPWTCTHRGVESPLYSSAPYLAANVAFTCAFIESSSAISSRMPSNTRHQKRRW